MAVNYSIDTTDKNLPIQYSSRDNTFIYSDWRTATQQVVGKITLNVIPFTERAGVLKQRTDDINKAIISGKLDDFIQYYSSWDYTTKIEPQFREAYQSRLNNINTGRRLSIQPIAEPTAGDILLAMRDANISLGDPQAKDWVLNKFPSIADEIKSQDKILEYEKTNNLTRVTPINTQTNYMPLVLGMGAIVILMSLKK
jgi:hypothetical protein